MLKDDEIDAVLSTNQVALTVWRKNDAPLLPLVLDTDEAERLAEMLTKAVQAATKRPNVRANLTKGAEDGA